VSSFQLDTIAGFRPRVAVLLNVTPDHMDRYDDFDAYAWSKGRIFENQVASDVAVLNGKDPAVAGISRRIAARKWFFNPTSPGEEGAYDEGGGLVFRIQGREDRKVDLSAVHLVGRHNRENIAAAALATLAAGGSIAGIERALKGFKGLPHRMSPVATVGGVRYVDDSKATNTDAVRRALEAFDRPVVLIMGGRDKGGGYDALRAAVRERVKHLVAIGEAREAIVRELGGCCGGRASMAPSMDAAVQRARQAAAPGDVVLLSPACASFDMFTSYAHRGEAFQRAVARLTKEV
jgi:UDP-N-acetylmuramoylalanine--D-glutamate ligase